MYRTVELVNMLGCQYRRETLCSSKQEHEDDFKDSATARRTPSTTIAVDDKRRHCEALFDSYDGLASYQMLSSLGDPDHRANSNYAVCTLSKPRLRKRW